MKNLCLLIILSVFSFPALAMNTNNYSVSSPLAQSHLVIDANVMNGGVPWNPGGF